MFSYNNIVEPMMDYYKDYNFVKDIIEMEFEEGWTLYKKCIDRINAEHEEKLKQKFWDTYLIEAQNGQFKGSFQEYYESKKAKSINSKIENKKEEEKRIIDKFANI